MPIRFLWRIPLYLWKGWMTAFLGSLLFFSLLFIIVVLSQELAWFIQIGPRTPFSHYVLYFAWWVPHWLIYTFPISALYATTYLLGRLAAGNELIGIYNAGIAIDRVMLPIYATVFAMSSLLLAFDKEFIYIPHQKHRLILESMRGYAKNEGPQVRRNITSFGSGNKIYFMRVWHQTNRTMEDVHILKMNAGMAFEKMTSARFVRWNDGSANWQAEGVVERVFSTNPETPPKVRRSSNELLSLGETPFHFNESVEQSELMGARDALQIARKYEIIGGNTRFWYVQYWSKTAMPFMATIIVFFGVPLSVFSRRNTMVLSFFLVLVSFLIYYALQQVGNSLGVWGVLPVPLAGWFGNLTFLALGAILRRILLR